MHYNGNHLQYSNIHGQHNLVFQNCKLLQKHLPIYGNGIIKVIVIKWSTYIRF